ncbi:hypothetical protein Plhal304r1_c029g0095831 [Plasmopara halstedii]
MRIILFLLSLLLHEFAILNAYSPPQHEKDESETVRVTKQNSQMVVDNDDKRNVKEERVTLDTDAIARNMMKWFNHLDDTQNANEGILPVLNMWLLAGLSRLVHGMKTPVDFEVVKILLGEGQKGYDVAIVQGLTPHFVKTMIGKHVPQINTPDLPTSSILDAFSERYRALMGIPGTTNPPVVLNDIWSSVMSRVSLLYRVDLKLQPLFAKSLIKSEANVQKMLSCNVRPFLYKKALIDLDILDEKKAYTVEEWTKIPALKQFLEYLKAANDVPDISKATAKRGLEFTGVASRIPSQ